MKSKNDQISSSILSNEINSFMEELARMAKHYLSLAPKDDGSENSKNLFNDFISTFSFKEDSYQQFIANCGLFAAPNPEENYKFFQKSFPDIKASTTSKPTGYDGGVCIFASALDGVDWSSPITRNVLYFITKIVISDFTIELLKMVETLPESSVKFFARELTFYIDAPGEINHDAIKSVIAKNYAEAAYYLSLISPLPTLTALTSIYSKYTTYEQKKLFFYVTSSLHTPDKPDDNFTKIFGSYISEFQSCDSANQIIFRDFLINLTLQTLTSDPHLETNSVYKSFYNYVKMGANASETLSCIFAGFTNYFGVDTDLIPVEYYMEQYVMKHIKDIPRVCYELIVKLRGANYEPEVLRLKKHHNFEWEPSMNNPYEFYQFIAQWIAENNSLFQNDSNPNPPPYVDLLLEQLAFLNLKLFMDIIIPKLIDKDVFSKPFTPFFHAMEAVIPTLEANGKKDHLPDLKKILLVFVTKCMMEQSLDPTLNLYMCSVASFTAALTQSGEDKDTILPRMCLTLRQTSFPLVDPSLMHSTNSLVQELISQIDKSSKAIYSADPIDFTQNFQDIADRIPIEEELLMMSLYLEPDSELARFLCSMVFSQSSYTFALTIRVLQAIVHRFPQFAEKAVRYLCNFFIEKKLSFSSIINCINTLMHVLEAANKENVTFPKETLNSVNYVAIIGLCVPVRSLRVQILKMCSNLASGKSVLFFQEFLLKYADKISKRALITAVKALAIKTDTELHSLPLIKFADVANSSFSHLYVFYIASMGYYLANSAHIISPDFTQSLLVAHRILTNIMMSISTDGKGNQDIPYLSNCTAMLISIHDIESNLPHPMIYFDNHRIQSIVHIMIELLANHKDLSRLNAIFSSISSTLIVPVTPLLGQPEWELQQPLIMCIADCFNRGRMKVLNDNGVVKNSIYTALHSALITIVRRGIVSTKCDFQIHQELDVRDLVFLNNFGSALKFVFDEIFEYHKKNMKLGVIESPLFNKEAAGHLFDGSKWFTFFFNICTIGLPTLISAFSSWLRISMIPEDLAPAFTEKIERFANMDIDIGASYLAHDPEKLIIYYMRNSRIHYSLFAGLANQLDVPPNLISNLKALNQSVQKSTGKPESKIIHLYYTHIGRLFGLCFSYLTSQLTAERENALNFIEKLTLITAFIREDAQSCVFVLKAIKDIRKRMTVSFSVFIQNEIFQLAQLIASHFEFCAEQFIREAISIVLQSKEGSMPRKSSGESHKSNTGERKSSKRLAKCPSQSRGVSIFGANMDEAIKKLSISNHQQLDYIDFNREEVIISFIPRWLTSFHYDVKHEGICLKSEPAFRAFTIHIFLEELLTMCSRFGLIPAIAIIINGIIDRNVKFFIFSLINLQNVSPAFKTSAMTFLIYIYNIRPDLFIENIMKYLSLGAWFFYKIQKLAHLTVPDKLLQEEEDKEPTNADYASIVTFILELLIECYTEDPEPLEKVKPLIIAFCDIMLSTNNPESDDASMIDENLAKLMDRMIFVLMDLYAEKAKTIAIIGPYIKQCPRTFFLEWGLCCGWLPAATRALQMFNYLHFTIEAEEIPLLLRAIQCVASILNERTDPSRISQFNKHWESQITMSKRGIDVKPSINYIAMCLDCLLTYITTTKQYPTEIFSTAVALMKCCTPDQGSIYALSVKILGQYIRGLNSPAVLMPFVGEGILPLFFLCSEADSGLLDEISSIIKTVVKANDFNILLRQDVAPIISLFVLMPSLWGAGLDPHLNTMLVESFVSKFGTDARHIVESILNSRSRTSQNIKKFCQKYLPLVPKDLMLQIIHIYVQFARHGTHEQQEAVMVFTNEIKNFAPMQEAQKDIASIAEIAVKNQSSQNVEGVLAFIRELVKLDFHVAAGPPPIASKMVSQFPVVNIYPKSAIVNWEPAMEDVFENPKNWPPLYVNDDRFVGAIFLEEELEVVKQVKEVHFSALDNLYKTALEQKPDRKTLIICMIDEIPEFIDEMVKFEAQTNVKVVKDASLWFKDQPIDTSVKPSVFFPGHSDLQEICKEEMVGLEIPFKLH